jgi:uncharacterized protein (DUF4415 family)
MTKSRKPLHTSRIDWASVAVPELSVADLRRMRPAREIAPEIVKAYERKRGRPEGRNKTIVSLSLDAALVAKLRASGKGWQTRVNDLLKAALNIQS